MNHIIAYSTGENEILNRKKKKTFLFSPILFIELIEKENNNYSSFLFC